MTAVFFIQFSMGFLTQKPAYTCTFNGEEPDDPDSVCTYKNICANDPRIATFEADYSKE